MKNRISFISFLLVILLTAFSIINAQHKFYVNLNDRADDLFKVTVIPEKLGEQNKIFQFAATAPGTYQNMDIGRYVKNFKAFDKNNSEIPVTNISLNQWEISNPSIVNKIVYEIEETWDSKITKNQIYAMCGTSLEKDFAVINGHCVFGYFHGMQKYPIEIKLEYPNEWTAGTALKQNTSGYFTAPNFDTVVDSPILLGPLTKASTTIDNTIIDVYTYSKKGLIKSDNLLTGIEDILNAQSQFTQGLPVDRYVFLFSFEDFSAGAWEHNYSSFYVFTDDTLNERYLGEIRSTAAHEFFHVITPLHIHSELIADFNYEKPVMSQHLWFYEGVTEWASDILQLRDYLISTEDYLNQVSNKLTINDGFDQNLPLTELGVKAVEKQDQYFNIYNKGAVVAALLDIRLLELSNGKKGLRELVLDLLKKYGAEKSISEKNFFNDLVAMTYPEIGDFIKNYISGAEKLPVKDYFGKLGIEYNEFAGYDSSKVGIGFGIGFVDNNFVVTNVGPQNAGKIQSGDILYKYEGEEITMQNIQQTAVRINSLKINETINFTVKRNGKEVAAQVTMLPRAIRHVFKLIEKPTPEQLHLRNAWSQNFMNYKNEVE